MDINIYIAALEQLRRAMPRTREKHEKEHGANGSCLVVDGMLKLGIVREYPHKKSGTRAAYRVYLNTTPQNLTLGHSEPTGNFEDDYLRDAVEAAISNIKSLSALFTAQPF